MLLFVALKFLLLWFCMVKFVVPEFKVYLHAFPSSFNVTLKVTEEVVRFTAAGELMVISGATVSLLNITVVVRLLFPAVSLQYALAV